MSVLLSLINKEFLVLVRSKKLQGLILAATAIALFAFFSEVLRPHLAEYFMPTPTGKQAIFMKKNMSAPANLMAAIANLYGFMSFFTLCLILIAKDSVATEINRGELLYTLLRPVRRQWIVVSKVVGLSLGILIALTFSMSVFFVLATFWLNSPNVERFLLAMLFSWVGYVAYASASIFFSTFARSASLAAALMFGFVLLLNAVGGTKYASYIPSNVFTVASSLATTHRQISYTPLLICLIWIVIFIVLASKRLESRYGYGQD